jgi:hypothetical protein
MSISLIFSAGIFATTLAGSSQGAEYTILPGQCHRPFETESPRMQECALSPEEQERVERNAIYEILETDPKYIDFCGNCLVKFIKEGDTFYLQGKDGKQLEVVVIYEPRPDSTCGPANFELEFGDIHRS